MARGDLGRDHLLQTPHVTVADARVFQVLHGIAQILRAASDVTHGAGKARRLLLDRKGCEILAFQSGAA